MTAAKMQFGWFSTGRDEAARLLLAAVQDAIRAGDIDGEIAFVFSNRERGEGVESDRFFELVDRLGLRLVTLSSESFRLRVGGERPRPGQPLPAWRAEYDCQVMRALEPLAADVCVLAGYMLIAGEEMCRRYALLNLHPAVPGGPAGTWQQVIWRLMEQDAESTGVMMHLATPQLDQGPPVTFCTFSIRGPRFDPLWEYVRREGVQGVRRDDGEENALFRLIRAQGVRREIPLIVATLRAFARGDVRIKESQVLDARGLSAGPRDLTAEIEAVLSREEGR